MRALVGKVWREALQAAALLSGWVLLTWGIASLTVWQAWPISAGLLLLSVVGWGFLKTLFANGLYTLSRAAKGVKRA